MKLQKLTIHNIASIEDAVIDFEAQPLSDSEVFLITGKTGSGKSTILDAICLALYADTPRMYNTNMQGDAQDGGETLSIDDPRQLLRRDAGEGKVSLTFVGNNGQHYLAEWVVRRANNKVSGKMQGKSWSLQLLPDGATLTKDAEIKQEIARAIELDFRQFCRTTLLAQGEFTRFLNSKDDEKAAILEKITDRDVFSKIGKKVFDETKEKENVWKSAQALTQGIIILREDEITARTQELADLDQQKQKAEQTREDCQQKLDWLNREEKLKDEEKVAETNYTVAQDVVNSDDFKARERLVSEWNDTIEARQHLKDRKEAVSREKQCQTALTALQNNEATIQNNLKTAEQDKKTAEEQLQSQDNAIKQLDSQLNTLDMPQLRKQQTDANAVLAKVTLAKDRLTNLNNEKSKRAQKEQEIKERGQKIVQKEKELTEMASPIGEARTKMEMAKTILDAQKDTIDKFASALRQKLRIGDICPVCRQEIKDALPHEEDLKKLVDGLLKTFSDAEKEYNEKVAAENKLKAEIKSERETNRIARDNFNNDKSVERAEQNALATLKELGVSSIDSQTDRQLEDIRTKQNEVLASVKENISHGELLEQDIRSKREKLEQQRALVNKLTDTYQKAKTAVDNYQRDKEDAEKRLRETQTRIQENQLFLDQFFAANALLSEARLEELNTISQQKIADITTALTQDKGNVSAKMALRDKAKQDLQTHLANRPRLTEEDTADNLRGLIDTNNTKLAELNQHSGAITQTLQDNATNLERLGKLLEAEQKAKAEYDKWQRLNSLIGDATGNKFRKIAQSYVLNSLIHSANSYMKTLTDRYRLKVTPGTFVISLEDAYQGYVTRAASTISGGESFLVSLSLALALSDIGQKLSVDTLFIDEGFGTLSGEPLRNAIDTLRALHDKSGRHVGIISHVEELRERIPVQIQVNQNPGSSSSTIQIVPELS
ncbi:MAG: AAA family ATPase [Paludibacteraceae bacterium]|nr:AAA family ATPase [Paludibacteraceae bacterium]